VHSSGKELAKEQLLRIKNPLPKQTHWKKKKKDCSRPVLTAAGKNLGDMDNH